MSGYHLSPREEDRAKSIARNFDRRSPSDLWDNLKLDYGWRAVSIWYAACDYYDRELAAARSVVGKDTE